MDRARREYINRLVDKIREVFELETPLNVRTVVQKLGGKLVQRDNEELECEASIQKDGNGFKIILDENAYKNRKRFSVAHELGHLFLHMGYLVDDDKWNSVGEYTDSVYHRYGYGIEENEASEFAAALLMPKEEFIEIANQNLDHNMYRIQPIAKHFDVSTEAASNRGKWLGLFQWE
ncbi:MAG: ImmA/IrrE family metallo-endopeptidase [Candidatus Omnitrophota bacterium]